MVSGWEVYGTDDKIIGEFDFLVISLKLKAVVHIEAKRQLDERSLNKAFEQLAKAKKLFQGSVPFPESEGWRYLNFIYTQIMPKEELAKICNECQKQLIQEDTDFVEWWKELQKSVLGSNSCPPPATTYLDIIKFIIFHMLAQEKVITTGTTSTFFYKVFLKSSMCYLHFDFIVLGSSAEERPRTFKTHYFKATICFYDLIYNCMGTDGYALVKQGTWLTRSEPRPQLEVPLYLVPS